MYNESTRSRNAWIYYTIFAVLLLGSCTLDESGLIKEEIKNKDICTEVGYKCTDYDSISTQFAYKELFTGDPSGYGMVHVKIKDSSLKEYFIKNVDEMYSTKEISYVGNRYILRVSDDEYWKIPGKKSDELYNKLNDYFFK